MLNYLFILFIYLLIYFLCFCVHYVFWCVLCVWAKLPQIKLDDNRNRKQKLVWMTLLRNNKVHVFVPLYLGVIHLLCLEM